MGAGDAVAAAPDRTLSALVDSARAVKVARAEYRTERALMVPVLVGID